MKHLWKSLVVALATAGLIAGCDQSGPSEANEGLQDFTYAFADDQLEMSKTAGIDVDETAGVFSIGWRQIIVPEDQTTTLRGDAMAIAFDGSQNETAPYRTRSGIDIGSVFLNYGGNRLELNKKEGFRRGIFYSLFPERPEPTEPGLEFIPGGTYEFEVTGSENFSPAKVSITAPTELISISSHVNGDQVDGSSDLTITWTGGSADGGVLIRLRPFFHPMGKGEMTRDRFMEGIKNGCPRHEMWNGQGGEGFGGGKGKGIHRFPMLFARGYVQKLDSNPGAITVPAADVQSIISLSGTSEIAVIVSQMSPASFDNNGKSYTLHFRNGDMRVLAAQ
jgi:hypothetical protein